MPPTVSVANPVGWLNGHAASHIDRACGGRAQHGTGWYCWARGYWVSPVGLDEPVIRASICTQA
jgi:putative transposase